MMNAEKPKLFSCSKVAHKLVTENETALKATATGTLRTPVIPFKATNAILGGGLLPGLHIVQAAPGAGKTAFALQAAACCGFPCLYVTAEMAVVELFRRVVARTTQTHLSKLRPGCLPTPNLETLIETTIQATPDLSFLDSTITWASPEDIRETAEVVFARNSAQKGLIVLDSLQFWAKGSGMGTSEYDTLNAALKSLVHLANVLSAPILVISHRNRQGNKAAGGLLTGLHTAKGSGDVEYLAESVIDLEREGNLQTNGKIGISLNILKNRHGIAGTTIPVEFNGVFQSFTER